MSNPAAPPTTTQTKAQAAFNDVPQSFLTFKDRESYETRRKQSKQLPFVLASVVGLDMEVRSSILLPTTGDEKTLNDQDHARKRPFAMANKGAVTCRIRSGHAMGVLKEVFSKLPEDLPQKYAFACRADVRKAMENKISVDGGTENCMGRLAKAYPKTGSSIEYPPMREETRQALIRCGINLKGLHPSVLVKIPFTQIGDERAVKVNAKADCGFPTNVKWEHAGAAEAVLKLANRLYADFKEAHKQDPAHGVWRLMRQLEDTHPWLVACKGKCKADAYSQEKVEEFMLRFYNALPKQIMLIMQSVSQVLEEQSLNILQFTEGRSMSGVSLVRDGPERLADSFERQLEESGRAYTHMGDDTKIAVLTPAGVVLFSLDCSNFDITQHADATAEIHAQVRDELSRVDPVAAQVWYAMARERLVVTYTNVVTKWKHGGPSGMPLQSKVNDVLMDVLVTRILGDADTAWQKRDSVEATVRHYGAGLGLSVRLEDYEVAYGTRTYREALEQKSFLFVGYRFFAEQGRVMVCADIPRSLAQFPFPALKWEKTKEQLLVMEAVRIGSIALNLGNAPAPLADFFEEFRRQAELLLLAAIAAHGDVESERMLWAVQSNPLVSNPVPSLTGMLQAVKNWRNLWETKEMPSASSTFLFPSSVSWADQVEEQERADVEASGGRVVRRRTSLSFLKQARLSQRGVPTHPVTLRNAGRPPPTAVWGPDKAPKRTREVAGERSTKSWADEFRMLTRQEEMDSDFGSGEGSDYDYY